MTICGWGYVQNYFLAKSVISWSQGNREIQSPYIPQFQSSKRNIALNTWLLQRKTRFYILTRLSVHKLEK